MLTYNQCKFWQSISTTKKESIDDLNDVEAKEEIRRLMFNSKKWDDSILATGGVSFYTVEETGKRHRVAQTYKGKFNEVQHTKMLKYKVKTASGEIFSVAAKTQLDAQSVVDSVFGKGHYRVSEALC